MDYFKAIQLEGLSVLSVVKLRGDFFLIDVTQLSKPFCDVFE